MLSAEPADLRPAQLVWLAAAVFVVAAGYGALLPLLPGWLPSMMPSATATEIARHIGLLSGVYSAGVLVGAPLWGVVSDRVGRGRILIFGLVGYVASLLLMLVPAFAGLWGIYALRGATGFFVAAVVPVVSALVADYTPEEQRARRFAWLGAMSLLGFLFGPGLNALADGVGSWAGEGAASSARSAQIVIVLSALLGAVMMLGLAATLPASRFPEAAAQNHPVTSTEGRTTALWCLSGAVMFVLAGFELGIVLQGQQHASLSSREIALMFAECSLVMLGVNALLFFTSLLEKTSARKLLCAGLILAMVGLAVLAQHYSEAWMYLGVSLTSAGTGLVLPVIAYLAAGTTRQKLGVTMGGLAAAAGLGQTLGSSIGGWLFGALAQRSFGWLTLPLVAMLILLVARPGWWSVIPAKFSRRPTGGSRF
ncbi:MFS transporter [Rhodoferax sp.]|uniref:MFS transporter n=1 Tax=Rhodoferax sp. TaxID=50421 RepID=UPI00271B923F|nr:MFS transporter [Rhodoferax sp.]MDO9195660.1 MFS transporter [Rhodoferax sp.]